MAESGARGGGREGAGRKEGVVCGSPHSSPPVFSFFLPFLPVSAVGVSRATGHLGSWLAQGGTWSPSWAGTPGSPETRGRAHLMFEEEAGTPGLALVPLHAAVPLSFLGPPLLPSSTPGCGWLCPCRATGCPRVGRGLSGLCQVQALTCPCPFSLGDHQADHPTA